MGRAWTSEKSQPGVKEKIPGLVLPAFADALLFVDSSRLSGAWETPESAPLLLRNL
jgi:hypothetical protein